ncbi:C39 family peptidase [Okeania sp. SIO2B3]|uniref:C39 family peptidase n=1 Tax=Okeania sp. SIO2B3 TaxID=2607784 RepID=UPI0013C02FBC|nr:C39 family peptidase [Okeania sp. SIO2B3]NET40621.1 C39 family peptidase [Okeania sp. SIO2B3]
MAELELDVEYLSQNDNWHNPSGSCNVTALAMVLNNLGIERYPRYKEYSQFEDELYQYALDHSYSRHSPYDLRQIAENYGANASFRSQSSIEELKSWMDKWNLPVIIHGYFTSFGHIVTVVGYDENGLIVHDPYGEWFSTGYRKDLSGAYLHYSYELIKRTCLPDGFLWCHFVRNLKDDKKS